MLCATKDNNESKNLLASGRILNILNITHENRNFKISILCRLPLHHVLWNYFLGKLNRQQKSILHPKKIIRIMAGTKRKASCREL
jgi:hypothetical protein